MSVESTPEARHEDPDQVLVDAIAEVCGELDRDSLRKVLTLVVELARKVRQA